MERYPAELLVGVFPLVFCVDATLSSFKTTTSGENADEPSNSSRSQFDRFLDAMAASLLEEPGGGDRLFADDGASVHSSLSRRRTGDDGMLSLFRGDEEGNESDKEDAIILGDQSSAHPFNAEDASVFGHALQRQTRPSFGFSAAGRGRASRRTSGRDSVNTFDTSFAKALADGQGFFQRARIVSISSRHGFPPSKDPNGEDSRISEYFLGKTLRKQRILAGINKRPIDGILPSGWLEKHAAALPSVIIVVVEVSSHQEQHEQDSVLDETMKNLQMSLASKRECTIHVVGLVQEGISNILAEQWSLSSLQTLKEKHKVTLLNVSDLSQDAPPSPTLRILHQTVHDASLRYYMTQARRTKMKLFDLGPARCTPLLLPIAIRYCFKVAMFYEFQWLPQKSLKYLVEAYRLTEVYFRYLLQQRTMKDAHDNGNSTQDQSGPKIRVTDQNRGTRESNETEGVEISLHNEDDIGNLLLNPPFIPDDMIDQCRVLADWLNFKILQYGLTSHTEGGISTASMQLQKHALAFCNPRRSFVCSDENRFVDWAYVAQQRLVSSQLLERNPPKILGDLGNDFDEVLLRCSPWKSYIAAGEALLRLGEKVEVARAAVASQPATKDFDEMRSRYIGGLDKNGYQPRLQEEFRIEHREQALDCFLRGIAFYERDVGKVWDNDASRTTSWNNSGARVYFLAGGTLLGLKRYSEAAAYLEKALVLVKAWTGLESLIRRMLIQCYENRELTKSGNLQSTTSALLDGYFNSKMSNTNLLKRLSCSSGVGIIQWHRECTDESDSSLPFNFAFHFPSRTHAIAGERVQATLFLKSNLNDAVKVDSITLFTLAGKFGIPSSDLLSAKNANEGSDGGIVIAANATIWISTYIKLPRDLDEISIDEMGNAGEKEGLGGKGSYSRGARPRTAGMTSAAGARMIPRRGTDDITFHQPDGDWSTKCLGGKPVRCEGLCLVFTPVNSAMIEEKKIGIELTIEKKPVVKESNVKKTPFEQENYISSSWARSRNIPMTYGPRCLRVLHPIAEITVTNLTESFTNGKLLEGTVNRIVLRLRAGAQEICEDIGIRVSCSSLLISPSGQRTHISLEEGEDETDDIFVNPRVSAVRTPVLVDEDESVAASMTEYGFEVPAGWTLSSGNVLSESCDDHRPVISTLQSEESTYAAFTLFRPTPTVSRRDVLNDTVVDDDVLWERSTCQTNIEISIKYRQKRTIENNKKTTLGKQKRKVEDVNQNMDTDSDTEESDLVYLNRMLPLTWGRPIAAKFASGLKDSQPSGNRHPNNIVGKDSLRHEEMVLIDGERVSTKCSFEAASSADGLAVDISEVRFQDISDEKSHCKLTLLSGKGDGELYKADPGDPSSKLILGSKFSLAWMSEVNMDGNFQGSTTASLGMLAVSWRPSPLEAPKEVKENGSFARYSCHGPLSLKEPCTSRFMAPTCFIERAPFQTTMDSIPNSVVLAAPFSINYHIENKTSLDQKVKVSLKEMNGKSNCTGLLLSGPISGEISLGPFETHTLLYTALPTRVGEIPFPQVSVTSDRYNSWLIEETDGVRRTLFVTPSAST